jgi:hypothetical protein
MKVTEPKLQRPNWVPSGEQMRLPSGEHEAPEGWGADGCTGAV